MLYVYKYPVTVDGAPLTSDSPTSACQLFPVELYLTWKREIHFFCLLPVWLIYQPTAFCSLPRATHALLTHRLVLQSSSHVDSPQYTSFWMCSGFLTPTQHRSNINSVHLNQQDSFGTLLTTVRPKHKCFWKPQECVFKVGEDLKIHLLQALLQFQCHVNIK